MCTELSLARRVTIIALAFATFSLLPGCAAGPSKDGPTTPGGTTISSIVIAPATPSLTVGSTAQLAATAKDASGNAIAGQVFTWTSSAANVASVSAAGLVTAKTVGSATITAAAGGKSATAAVVVTANTAPVASVVVSPASLSLSSGAQQQMSATLKDASGNTLTGRAVSWTSSAPAVASISASGLLSAQTPGTTTISAVSEGKTGTAAITVIEVPSGLVTDPNKVFDIPAIARPDYRAAITPTPFGSSIIRIANEPGTAISFSSGGSGSWGSDARHHYQKDQPWSADGKLLVLQNSGSPSVVYLDGDTYQPVKGKCSNYSLGDDRWHPALAHARERINVSGTRVEWFDVVSCTQTRVWTLPFSSNGFGSGEGNPSFDGRFAALSNGTQLVVVDMDPQPPYAAYPNKRIGPVVDITDCGIGSCSIDWVSISPSGLFALVSYDGDYPRVYDVDPATLALTPRSMGKIYSGCHGTADKGFVYDLGHADMTLDPSSANDDVLVGQEHCGNRGKTVDGKLMGSVVEVRLRDGMPTPLTDPSNEAYAHHISARAFDRPGWVYVGYYPQEGKRFADEVVAIQLGGTKAVERLAHKHSDFSSCYRCESHAVPSRDGRRALFASNWAAHCGTACGLKSVINAYIVDTR